jgi:hypothetical protein
MTKELNRFAVKAAKKFIKSGLSAYYSCKKTLDAIAANFPSASPNDWAEALEYANKKIGNIWSTEY